MWRHECSTAAAMVRYLIQIGSVSDFYGRIRSPTISRSTAHSLALGWLIPLADRHLILLAGCRRAASSWFIDRVSIIANSYTAPIIAEVVDAAIDIVIDHLTCLQEGLLHVETRLGRRLQEDEAVLLGEALALLRAHLTPAIEVSLISYEHEHNVWVAILTDFLEPTR